MLPTSDRLRPVTVDTRRGADQLRRILETLARVELTDGLTLAELVMETSARLPRDATVVAIVPQASPEAALALGGLRRRGFAVTVVLVMHDDDLYAESAGRLIAAGVDVLRIEDEAAVSSFCSRQMVR